MVNKIPTAWAKLVPADAANGRRRWHSLVGHGTDVAAVLEALLATSTIRDRLTAAAGIELTATTVDRLCRLCVLAFLHDLGKANLGFWSKQFPEHHARRCFGIGHAGHVRETAPLFGDPEIWRSRPRPRRRSSSRRWNRGGTGRERSCSRCWRTTAAPWVRKSGSPRTRGGTLACGGPSTTTIRSANSRA
jgi:hypothetical protein